MAGSSAQRGKCVLWPAVGFLLLAATSGVAAQGIAPENLRRDLDLVWMLVASGLVLMMQVGFLMLEAGMVRSKNSINVAQKNFLDMAFAIVAFAVIGFMIAFGTGGLLPVGIDGQFLMLSDLTNWQIGFFVFQVMFCGTSATIVSGAVAERMRLSSYVLCSIVVSAVIYPVFVHWAWGTALFDNSTAFLAKMGFVDFAGSTVVHSTGAWVSLAACIVMGPRIGRFDGKGRPMRIAGHNPVLSAAGALVLFVGWIGFNGGSTVAAVPSIAPIIANTVLAAGAGGVAGYLIGWYTDGVVFPEKALSGMLGGLVAVTAGCAVLDLTGALLIGVIGGVVALWGNTVLEEDLGIDDAVGAIGVHGFAGVTGTLVLALLAPVENLPAGDRLEQLQIQALGSVLNFAWAFGVGYAFFRIADRWLPLRVTAEEEDRGLNEAEHGTRMGIGHVEKGLGALITGNADLSMRLPVVEGDDSELLTHLFNRLMENIQSEEQARGEAAMVIRDMQEAERLSALSNATFEAIWMLQEGRIIDGNHKLEELFGAPLHELKGRHVFEFIEPNHRPRVLAAMQEQVVDPYEVEILDVKGNRIPVEMRGREISYRGINARVGCLVDLRQRKNDERRIRHLAMHDPLTGLPNRAVFTERLETLVTECDGFVFQGAVMMVDLDRFKDINDVHGHPAGDTVIRIAGERLSQAVGPSGTVARLGGDEFAVLIAGLSFANQAADLAFRMVTALAHPIDIGGGTLVRVGGSIGVALCPRDGKTPDKLVSRADTALYRAKDSGRNTYCVFEPGMDLADETRRLLEADLTAAISDDQFELHFQPRVNVDSRSIISYEALLRWRHPQRGLISPADFIPIAEQTGKIIVIGEWVLRTACQMAISGLSGAKVSVNVSPVQFRQKTFIEMLKRVLAETNMPPSRLELEITEGVLIDDDKRAYRILNEVKALGLTVALDDFGTGYSSLAYLSRFPFDTIKIDRSFVREMTSSDNARAIVRSIIGLGTGLNMNIVAEGVEIAAEAQMLADHGCRELQGFLIGRPVPADQLAQFTPEMIAAVVAGMDVDPPALRLGAAAS